MNLPDYYKHLMRSSDNKDVFQSHRHLQKSSGGTTRDKGLLGCDAKAVELLATLG